MQHFSRLIRHIDMTNSTNRKRALLVEYFQTAPSQDKLWLLALFTGKRPKRPVNTALMRQWCQDISGIPQWLFDESYHAVGDLGETIALLLADPVEQDERALGDWMEDIIALAGTDDVHKRNFVTSAWRKLDANQRFVFNKLIGGSFRIGISRKTIVNALADYSGQESHVIMHALSGHWSPLDEDFDALIHGHSRGGDASKPYPFCLAYPLSDAPDTLGAVEDWIAEYKWDGIRGQIIRRNGEIYIWSRGEELVTEQFPELVAALSGHDETFVIDGEILPRKDGLILDFSDLQKRLNRKNVTKALLRDVPIVFYAYDCLEHCGEDLRNKPLSTRRVHLEHILKHDTITDHAHTIQPSLMLDATDWSALAQMQGDARSVKSEGLMLKRKNSPYHSGRTKGDWWKWKVDPLTIDAVMIYAQRGSGRRSGMYSDYTFAVRDGDELVPIAKAYSGLSQQEIREVSAFVRQNSLEKFGPVRTVKAELVFELAFEGIAWSKRHKSGVALRFPRISRWRRDKTVAEIDTLDSVKAILYQLHATESVREGGDST